MMTYGVLVSTATHIISEVDIYYTTRQEFMKAKYGGES